MTLEKYSKYLIYISIALYVLSLFFAGFYVRSVQQPYGGVALYILAIGWIGIIAGHFSWLANPLIALALVINKAKPKLAIVLSFSSLLFALSFLLHDQILTDEGGGTNKITSYGFGSHSRFDGAIHENPTISSSVSPNYGEGGRLRDGVGT